MAQVRDYNKLAHDIIREVGGAQNIVNATRCATRFRLVLKETPAGAKEKISEMPGVITVVENNGQFQVVIGTHVGDVYAVAAEILHLDENTEEVEQPKQSVVNRIIATMSAVICTICIHSGCGRSAPGCIDPDHNGGTKFCKYRNL